MTERDTQPITDYIDRHKRPCRFCLKDVIDCQKPGLDENMKIDADTLSKRLAVRADARVPHKALFVMAPDPKLPEHKYGIAIAAVRLMEHDCNEGKNFRLAMKALAENRRYEVRPRRELTGLGASGTDVADPATYSEPWTLTRKMAGPLDGTEGS